MRIAKMTNVIVFLAKMVGVYIRARVRLLAAILGGAVHFVNLVAAPPLCSVCSLKISDVLFYQKIQIFFGKIAS